MGGRFSLLLLEVCAEEELPRKLWKMLRRPG